VNAFLPEDRDPASAAPLRPATLPPGMAAALDLISTLSLRERAVFHLLGLGHDNRSIARELTLSERTVKRHISSVLAKLHLQSRLQAGLVALIVRIGSSPDLRAEPWWPEGRMAAAATSIDSG
jgi:DNA-binding NarL/FixJ family response regulator